MRVPDLTRKGHGGNAVLLGVMLAIVSTCLNAVTPLLSKVGLGHVSPISGSLIEAATGSLLALIGLACRGRLPLHADVRQLSAPAICYACGIVSFFFALSLASPAVVGMLGRLQVVFAVLISALFLREHLTALAGTLVFGALLAGVGIAIDPHRPEVPFAAIALIVLFSLSFAVSGALIKRTRSSDTLLPVAMNYWFALLFTAVVSLIYSPGRGEDFEPSPLLLLAASAALTFLSLLGFYKSLQLLSYRLATLIRAGSPIVTLAVSQPFYPETITPLRLLSGMLFLVFVGWLATIESASGLRKRVSEGDLE